MATTPSIDEAATEYARLVRIRDAQMASLAEQKRRLDWEQHELEDCLAKLALAECGLREAVSKSPKSG